MDQELQEWFRLKAGNPEFIKTRFFPALERIIERVVRDLRQIERDGDLTKIKYAIGRFDGVHEIVELIKNLRLSEDEKPAGPGLMVRISRSFR